MNHSEEASLSGTAPVPSISRHALSQTPRRYHYEINNMNVLKGLSDFRRKSAQHEPGRGPACLGGVTMSLSNVAGIIILRVH